MANYPRDYGWHTDPDTADESMSPDSFPAAQRYPLEWGWHTDLSKNDAPQAPVFAPVMPTLLGGTDPDMFPIGVPPVAPTPTGLTPASWPGDSGPGKGDAPVDGMHIQELGIPANPIQDTSQSADEENDTPIGKDDAALPRTGGAREIDRRLQVWDAMLRRQPPQALPGSGIQAPLSADWQADLDKIDPSYARLTDQAAKSNGIPPELLARLLHRESHYNRLASNGGHLGIPQLGADALKDLGLNAETFRQASAETQINAGAAYLAKQYRQMGSWPKAVAAYHHGAGAIDGWFRGTGTPLDTEYEQASPYLDKRGNVLATAPREIKTAASNGKSWRELENELSYVFMGNPYRYDGPGNP